MRIFRFNKGIEKYVGQYKKYFIVRLLFIMFYNSTSQNSLTPLSFRIILNVTNKI